MQTLFSNNQDDDTSERDVFSDTETVDKDDVLDKPIHVSVDKEEETEEEGVKEVTHAIKSKLPMKVDTSNRKAFLLTCIESMPKMDPPQRFKLFSTVRDSGLIDVEPALAYKVIHKMFKCTTGADLSVLKRSIDYVMDLTELLNKSEMPAEMTNDLITHFKANVGPLSRLHVLSDIDDTLFSNLLDKRYPHKTVYPGVRQFYFELNAANEHILDANIRFDDDGSLGSFGPGRNITFLSARPRFLAASTLQKMNTLGLHGASILPGNLSHLVTHGRMAAKKLENFLHYRQIYPEVRFLFIGDNGQGDIDLGKVLAEKHRDQVVFIGIHNVYQEKRGEKPPRFDECVAADMRLFNTYVGIAFEVAKMGGLEFDAVQRVALAATEELSTITWKKSQGEKKRARWDDLTQDVAQLLPYLSPDSQRVLSSNFEEVRRRCLKDVLGGGVSLPSFQFLDGKLTVNVASPGSAPNLAASASSSGSGLGLKAEPGSSSPRDKAVGPAPERRKLSNQISMNVLK
jgi:hypothetical protein